MSGAETPARSARPVPLVWLLVALGGVILVAANAHLVYVAATSQPECVAHWRQGERNPAAGSYSAAQSSCSPSTTTRAKAQPE